MVRGQILFERELKGLGSQEALNLLKERIGASEGEIGYIRSLPSKERIVPAAELLYESTGRSDVITVSNISVLALDDWSNSGKLGVSYGILNMMKPRMQGLDSQLVERHKIPYIQLLREEVTGEQHSKSVSESSKTWKNFRFGDNDWLRSVKIPCIEPDSSLLLGIYWGDAYASRQRYVTLNGMSKDFPFYKRIVNPLVKRVHGLEVPVETSECKSTINGREFYSERPMMKIGSTGIYSWLVGDLGFPKGGRKRNVSIPDGCMDRENKAEFFYGIVGTMGSFHNGEDFISLSISEKDETFVRNLKRLSESLGYTPIVRYSNKEFEGKFLDQYKLDYSQREVKRMKLINPRHKRF